MVKVNDETVSTLDGMANGGVSTAIFQLTEGVTYLVSFGSSTGDAVTFGVTAEKYEAPVVTPATIAGTYYINVPGAMGSATLYEMILNADGTMTANGAEYSFTITDNEAVITGPYGVMSDSLADILFDVDGNVTGFVWNGYECALTTPGEGGGNGDAAVDITGTYTGTYGSGMMATTLTVVVGNDTVVFTATGMMGEIASTYTYEIVDGAVVLYNSENAVVAAPEAVLTLTDGEVTGAVYNYNEYTLTEGQGGGEGGDAEPGSSLDNPIVLDTLPTEGIVHVGLHDVYYVYTVAEDCTIMISSSTGNACDPSYTSDYVLDWTSGTLYIYAKAGETVNINLYTYDEATVEHSYTFTTAPYAAEGDYARPGTLYIGSEYTCEYPGGNDTEKFVWYKANVYDGGYYIFTFTSRVNAKYSVNGGEYVTITDAETRIEVAAGDVIYLAVQSYSLGAENIVFSTGFESYPGTYDNPYEAVEGENTAPVPSGWAVYFTYTASANGTITFTYEGITIRVDYEEVASGAAFNVVEGTKYLLEITGDWETVSSIDFSLAFEEAAAVEIDGELVGSETIATPGYFEPSAQYVFTATVAGKYLINVVGKDASTWFQIYTPNGENEWTKYTAFPVELVLAEGETVTYRLYGWDAAVAGQELTVEFYYAGEAETPEDPENPDGPAGLEGSGTTADPYVITGAGNYTADEVSGLDYAYYVLNNTTAADMTVTLTMLGDNYYVCYGVVGFDYLSNILAPGVSAASITLTADSTLYIAIGSYNQEAVANEFSIAIMGEGGDVVGGLEGSGTTGDPYVITESGDYTTDEVEGLNSIFYAYTNNTGAEMIVTLTIDGSDYYVMYGVGDISFLDTILTPGAPGNPATITVAGGATLYVAIGSYSGDAQAIDFSVEIAAAGVEPGITGTGVQNDPYIITDLGDIVTEVSEGDEVYYAFVSENGGNYKISAIGNYWFEFGTYSFMLCDQIYQPEFGDGQIEMAAGKTLFIKVSTADGAAGTIYWSFTEVQAQPETTETELVIGNNGVNAEDVTFAYTATEAGTLTLTTGASIMGGNVQITYAINGGAANALALSSSVELPLAAGDKVVITVIADGDYTTVSAAWEAAPAEEPVDFTGTYTATDDWGGTKTVVIDAETVTISYVHPMTGMEMSNVYAYTVVDGVPVISDVAGFEFTVTDGVLTGMLDNGTTYTLTLAEGGGDEGGDDPANGTELVLGANTVVIGEDQTADGVDYTFVAEVAGTYTFSSNDLLAIVFDANGVQLGRAQVSLAAGTYTVKVVPFSGAGTFTMNVSVVADGGAGGGDTTEPDGSEDTPYEVTLPATGLATCSDAVYMTWYTFTVAEDGTLTVTYSNTNAWFYLSGGSYSNEGGSLAQTFTYAVTADTTYVIGLGVWDAEEGVTVDLTFTAGVAGGDEGGDTTECEHVYSLVMWWHPDKVYATCVAGGIDVYQCELCYDEYTQASEIDPTAHDYVTNYDTYKAPTCLEDGWSEKTCSLCGDQQSGAIDHTVYGWHSYVVDYETLVEPTCQSAGYRKEVCSVCGDEQVYEEEASSWYHVNEYSSNYSIITCSVCGNVTIDAYIAATETSYGVQFNSMWDGTPYIRIWNTDDLGDSYTYTMTLVDGVYVLTLTNMNETVNLREITSVTVTPAYGGIYVVITFADETALEVNNDTHEHEHVATEVAANCTEQGYTSYACVCGDSYIDESSLVDPLGHSWVDATDDVPKHCSACWLTEKSALINGVGNYRTDDFDADNPTEAVYTANGIALTITAGSDGAVRDAAGAQVIRIDGKDTATITAGGKMMTGIVWRFPGLVTADNYYAKGMTTLNGLLASEAGLTGRNVDFTYSIVENGHTYYTFIFDEPVAEFRFTTFNYLYIHSLTVYYLADHEHTVVEDAAVEATCTEPGLTAGSHCSVCGETIVAQEPIDALGHTEVEDAAVDATCSEDGLTAGSHCEVCDEVIVAQETVAATGEHNYVKHVCTVCSTIEAGNHVATVADALTYAEGVNVVITGTVSSIYQAYDSYYGNISVYIADETGTILAYRLTGNVGVGDKITVTGAITPYYGVNQLAAGCTFVMVEEHVCSEYTEATCTTLATCKVCGATTGELADHEYVDGKCTCGAEEGVATITASKTMEELITANGWTSSTTKQTFTLDDNVTVKINGGSNTGKAYENNHIRIYATDSPAGTITITVPEGYELVSVKVSTVTGTYAFLYVDGTTVDICNTTTAVSGNSVVLTSAKNGANGKQVRVTAIEVVYKAVV